MIKGIIFDFRRTLYIPEIDAVPKENLDLLKELNLKYAIISVSPLYEIEPYLDTSLFEFIFSVDKKTASMFERIINNMNLEKDEVLVVGDRIKSEILGANKAGLKTVWLKQGKFADELPDYDEEQPNYTITSLNELKNIIGE